MYVLQVKSNTGTWINLIILEAVTLGVAQQEALQYVSSSIKEIRVVKI